MPTAGLKGVQEVGVAEVLRGQDCDLGKPSENLLGSYPKKEGGNHGGLRWDQVGLPKVLTG